MWFESLQENIVKGLNIASRFISSRPQLPVLANILLSTEKNKLKLKATNLESGITLEVGAKVEEEKEITIPAKTLTEFIGSLPPGKVSFHLEENNLKIRAMGFQATINGLSATEFPPLPVSVGKFVLSIKTEEILRAISQVAFAAAQDEGKPVLSGVKIFNEGGNLVFVATDGYRLSLKKTPGSSSFDGVLPARTMAEAVRIAKEGNEEKINLETTEGANQAIFSLSNAEIVCRLLEGQFPSYEKIIPTGFSTKVILPKEEFLSAIKTAAIFAREAANIVRIGILKDGVKVSANAPQVGENETFLGAKVEGEETEIAFNSRFLLDYLGIVSQEEISFEMNGPLSPGAFRPVGDETFLHIIMPVKVQS